MVRDSGNPSRAGSVLYRNRNGNSRAALCNYRGRLVLLVVVPEQIISTANNNRYGADCDAPRATDFKQSIVWFFVARHNASVVWMIFYYFLWSLALYFC